MEVSLRTKIIVGFFWGLGILLLCFGAGGEVLIFFVIGFICLKVGQKFYKEDETPKESTPKQLTPKQIEMKERQEKISELKRLGKPFCMKCLGTNIQFAFVTTGERARGTIETKKRSLAERTVNKTGRGLANMATMGLYGAVTPKKGKYKEYTSSTTTVHSQKMALCQDCGNS